MEAPMVKHSPPVTTASVLDTYNLACERALDAYKHGDISESEALGRFERAQALLTDSLRSHYVVRLRNLEAFRTPRGEQTSTTGGR
jgi:hypothetical protein